MPARRFPTKHRRSNAKGTSPKFTDSQLSRVLKAIETERGNLSRADSLLGCLRIAMEYGETTHKGPYYPDVAQIAHKIVRKSIRALDPINLPKPPRGKVLEEFNAAGCAPPEATLHEVPLLSRTTSTMFPRPCSLRIHRRNYFRSSAMNVSSMELASANNSG
jgi:hypothetical protein